MTVGDTEKLERRAARAARLLAAPEARLEAAQGGYVVRVGDDRRRRALLRLDEAEFVALVRLHGLTPLSEGAWRLSRLAPGAFNDDPPMGPSRDLAEGERLHPDGVRRRTLINRGESPLAWLARRKDKAGQPYLTPAELAAGERLREAFERAGVVGALTMNWTAQPRRGRGGGALDPVERGLRAKADVAAALDHVGPALAPLLQRVCLLGSALVAAERGLGLSRRSGKRLLKAALHRLAQHYRLI